MSSVLFTCPIDGCGFRGFDEPPKTKLVCRHHGDTLVQDEPYTGGEGADFRFAPVVAVSESGTATVAAKPALTNSDEVVEKAALREEYRQLTGVNADRRWNLDRLRVNVQHAKEQMEEST